MPHHEYSGGKNSCRAIREAIAPFAILHPSRGTLGHPLLNGRPFVLVFIAFLVNNVEKWEKVWRIGRKCLLLHDYLDVRIDEMND